MTGPDDKHDAELKPYLDGQDGVSAAYRKASGEQPPAGLDAVILHAARQAVAPVDSGRDSRWGKYRIAASFMAGVLVTTLYVDPRWNAGEDVAASLAPPVRQIVVPPREAVPQPTPVTFTADAPAPALNRDTPAPVSDATNATVTDNLTVVAPLPPPEDTRVASAAALQVSPTNGSDPVPAAELARQEAQRANSEALQVRPLVVSAQDAAGAAEAGVEPNSPLEEIQVTGNQVAETSQLEEVTVTGSRIRNSNVAPSGYRANREDWLQYILDKALEVQFLVEELGAANISLEEEMLLFSAEYPDVDVEAELANQGEAE